MKNLQKRLMKCLILASVAGLLAACGSSNSAPPAATPAGTLVLYGTTHGASNLLELDPADGSLVQVIGPVGFRVNGLTFDPTDGKLYATTSNGDVTSPDSLIEIDVTTGVGTLIGVSGGLINIPTFDSTGAMFAWTEDSDELVSVDKTTGVATLIPGSGLSTLETGLSFDNNDILYLVNNDNGTGDVHTIDTTTGAATYVGDIGQMAHHGDFHPITNKYWGIDVTGTGVKNILVVDIATPVIDTTLPTADDLFTVAFGYL